MLDGEVMTAVDFLSSFFQDTSPAKHPIKQGLPMTAVSPLHLLVKGKCPPLYGGPVINSVIDIFIFS